MALSEDEIEHYLGKAYTKALIACVTFRLEQFS